MPDTYVTPRDATIILTRPVAQSRRFAAQLQAGFTPQLDVSICPVLEIVPLPIIQHVQPAEALIFTSENGVLHLDQDVSGYLAYCVGPRTAAAARARGCRVVDSDGDADRLVSMLSQIKNIGSLVHVRGKITRGDIVGRLSKLGIPIRSLISYAQQPVDQTIRSLPQQIAGKPHIFPVCSPRTADILMPQLVAHKMNVWTVCISETVADVVRSYGFDNPKVALAPNGREMVQSTRALWRDINDG